MDAPMEKSFFHILEHFCLAPQHTKAKQGTIQYDRIHYSIKCKYVCVRGILCNSSSVL